MMSRKIPEEIILLSSDDDEVDDRVPNSNGKHIDLEIESDDNTETPFKQIISPSLLRPIGLDWLPPQIVEPKTTLPKFVSAAESSEEMILPDIDNEDDVTNPVTSLDEKSSQVAPDTSDEVVVSSSSAAVRTSTHSEAPTVPVVQSTIEDLPDDSRTGMRDSIDETDPNSVVASTSEILDPPKPAKSMEKLVVVLKKRLTKHEFGKVQNKLWKVYGELDFSTPEHQTSKSVDEVYKAIEGCANQIMLDQSLKWSALQNLIQFLRSHPNTQDVPVVDAGKAELRKQKKIAKLERSLLKYEKIIEKWDKKDDELDEEHNSPYLVKTRLVNRYMKVYTTLCNLTGCSTMTGRPTQKKIKIIGVTRYPEIDTAVEKLLNSKGSLFVPDYHDVLNIAKNINTENRLHLSPLEIDQTAQELFQKVVRMLHKRREKDLSVGLDIEDATLADPADTDPELNRKLEENRKIARTEEQVLKEFVNKQNEQKLAAVEVCDVNPDDSAEESDDEEDSDDAAAEDGQEDGNAEEAAGDGGGEAEVSESEESNDLATGVNGCSSSSKQLKRSNEIIDVSDSDSSSSSDGGKTGRKTKKPRLDSSKSNNFSL